MRETLIRIEGRPHDVDVVVFDKDGTLVEVGDLWEKIMSKWVESVIPSGSGPDVRSDLAAALGVDAAGRLVPNGIAHTGTLGQMRSETERVLAANRVESAHSMVMSAAPILETFDDGDVTPLGEVRSTVEGLSEAGLGLVVATSDNRAPTESQLALLGITHLFDLVLCGDDPIEPKPSPAVLGHVSSSMGVTAHRIAMVGDSASDMATGRDGGAGVCIGVTGGGGVPDGADVLIETIESIETVE